MGVMSFSTPAEDFIAQTIERPWIPDPTYKGGQSGVSCVPVGTYKLEVHNSEAHPMTWALVNPDLDVIHWPDEAHPQIRALVLIHIANQVRELRGCIAVGRRRTTDQDGVMMVLDSRLAMDDLQRLLPYTNGHSLEIR
jgi:hypothetical protein